MQTCRRWSELCERTQEGPIVEVLAINAGMVALATDIIVYDAVLHAFWEDMLVDYQSQTVNQTATFHKVAKEKVFNL